jgi:hypothetical protein
MTLRRRSHACRRTVALLAGLAAVGASLPATAQELRFAALGDLPYTEAERQGMPGWLSRIAATDPAFAIHVGDFKASHAPCTDATFADRHALFDASPMPLVFTPGDNEWTDCERPAGQAFEPAERLAALRRLFFSRPESLGRRRIALEQQTPAPENLRWQTGGVVFLTLNLPAGNNHGLRPQPSAEMLAREPLILAWLREGFAAARQADARAVVIAFQANPGFKLSSKGLSTRAFRPFLETLRSEARRLNKPVLLIHGDTHTWRFDRPLASAPEADHSDKVWRIEVPGSPFPGWVEVRCCTDDAAQPFSATLHPLRLP